MMRVDHRDLAGSNVFDQSTTSERLRRGALLPCSLAAIAAIALASGCYFLFSYGRPIGPVPTKMAPAARIADSGVTREEFQASQQKTATQLEAMGQDIAASKADIKKLSDQVLAMSAKVDALRDAAAAWPTSSIERQPNVRAKAPTKSSRSTAN